MTVIFLRYFTEFGTLETNYVKGLKLDPHSLHYHVDQRIQFRQYVVYVDIHRDYEETMR